MPENNKVTTGDVAQTFPPPPTPLAETPVAGEPTTRYFVVLHDGLDNHVKDAIVSLETLGGPDNVERLLRIGAIRPLER